MARHRLKHYVEYIPILLILSVLKILPYRLGVAFGSFLGMVGWSVLGIRKDVALENLRRCFPDKYGIKDLEKIGLESYKNFGRSMLEYALITKLRDGRISRYVRVENRERFDKLIGEGKGCIGVTGHFGSWEVAGAILSNSWPAYIDFLVGEQHNLLVNNLMNRNRHLMGIGTIEMGMAARGVLASVRRGKMVAMLSDQDAGKDGVIINLFGLPASTPKGPAAFALKEKKPIAMAFIIREKGPYHRMICEKPIVIKPSGNKDDDIKVLTQKYTDVLESYIRQYPDHWFWAHRRFKSTLK